MQASSSASFSSVNSSQQVSSQSAENQANLQSSDHFQFSLNSPIIEDKNLGKIPAGSIASDILSANVFGSPRLFPKGLNLLTGPPDDRLSDFGSCKSAGSDSTDIDDSEGYTVVGKEKPKKKRKAGISPLKEDDAKKMNVKN